MITREKDIENKLQDFIKNWKDFYESNKHKDMLDRDGYPTEIALELIEKWHWTDSKGWFEFIREIWYVPNWGWKEKDEINSFDKNCHRYYISTSGWSGNESIIRSMASNKLMWDLCWIQSRRGGHYIFELVEFEDD